VRVEGAAKGKGELEKDGWSLDARVKKNNAFFFVFIVPLKPGSVRLGFFWFQVSETEPKFFKKILIGLVGFFYGSVFLVIFFSVFSV